MRFVYAPAHRQHDPVHEVQFGIPIPYYEAAVRAEAIRATLEADGSFRSETPTAHGLDPILAVHDAGLVRYLETAWQDWQAVNAALEMFPDTILHPALREGMGPVREPDDPVGRLGYWCFETLTPIVPGTYAAARAAVDVALTAADVVLGGARVAYGLCRPPGHHAPRAAFGGYCYLNNAAVAAQYLVDRTGGPVAVLDVDFHHGNGTQQIFYARSDVVYVSLHGDPARVYPYFAGYASETGAHAGTGATFNLPLPAGCDDEQYLAHLGRALDRVEAANPAVVVVSLGVDTYRDDPLGDFRLETESFEEAGRRVAALGRPLVILQEGGYQVSQLGENVRRWLIGADGRPRFERGEMPQ
jgi:acetoin utilization deacetylase AcuC-like enzyme